MADSELRRTHPLTVLIRAGTALAQAVAGFVALAFASLAGERGIELAAMAGLVAVGALLLAAATWLKWAYFRFGVTGDHLVIDEGWLFKKHRSIPLARIQGVDIRADLLSRMLGLANVVVQTAGGGGGEAEAAIGSITLAEAEALRTQLISGRAEAFPAAAEAPSPPASPGSVPERTMTDPVTHLSDFRGALGGTRYPDNEPVFEHAVAAGAIIIAALTSNGTAAALAALLATAVAAVVLAAVSAPLLSHGLGIALLSSSAGFPVILVLGSSLFSTIARYFGFRVRRTGPRLETESGLFERRMTSVPVRRIQAVIVEASAVRRLFALASVRVNTAGFGQGEEEQATTAPALLPIVRAKEVRPLLHRLLPEAEQFPHTSGLPARSLRFYVLAPTLTALASTLVLVGGPLAANRLVGASLQLELLSPLILAFALAGFGVSTVTARWLAWRAAGFGLDERSIAIAYGALGRNTARVSRSRIQSLAIRQSPFQRAAGLATLKVVTVSGSGRAVFAVQHLPLEYATAVEAWYSPSPEDAR